MASNGFFCSPPVAHEWALVNVCTGTSAPEAPTITRVVTNDRQVSVSWGWSGREQVLGYELGLRAGTGPWDDSYSADFGRYDFTGLMNGTTYTIRVRVVVAGGGTSAWATSSPVTPVAPSQAPGLVTLDSVRPGANSADLLFQPVDHATSYVIQWLTEAQWTAAQEGTLGAQITFGGNGKEKRDLLAT